MPVPAPITSHGQPAESPAVPTQSPARPQPAQQTPTQPIQIPQLPQIPQPPLSPLESDVDPDVAAGYKDCLKETIRFLVEEEGLPPEHPVVEGLMAHLNTSSAHVELTKLSRQLNDTPTPEPRNAGYEITLVVDDSDEEEEVSLTEEDLRMMEDMDVEEEEVGEDEVREALESDPELQRQLLRMVYQGCDLVVQPQPPQIYSYNLPVPHVNPAVHLAPPHLAVHLPAVHHPAVHHPAVHHPAPHHPHMLL